MIQLERSCFSLLLAEDEQADIELVEVAAHKSSVAVTIYAVRNGLEALRFLRKEGEYAGTPTPDLILLDLNMPIMGGHETLMKIKSDESLKHLPVIILTTSQNMTDVHSCYKHYVNCFIEKPTRLLDFQNIIESTLNYWFKCVTLPN